MIARICVWRVSLFARTVSLFGGAHTERLPVAPKFRLNSLNSKKVKPKYSYLGLPAPRAHRTPLRSRKGSARIATGGSSARHTTRDPPPRPREPCSPFSPRASMPKTGRPCKQDGSPATRARREMARIKKRGQLERRALGLNRPTGRPPKQQKNSCPRPDPVAAKATDLDKVAHDQSSSTLNYAAKGSSAPAPQRHAHKPLTPDGNPASPHPPGPPLDLHPPGPALLTITAEVFVPEVAHEELCLICMQRELGIAEVLPYLMCCAGRIHDTCLARWRQGSNLRNGQKLANAHNCPHCKTHLAGTRDLRDAPPTDAEMRQFKLDRGGQRHRRLDF